MRLIDADALMKDISVLENGLIDMLSTYSADEWDECRDRFIILVELENTKVLKEVIEEAPTVERPRGEWISVEDKKPRRRAEYLCIYQLGDKAEYRYCGVLMFHPEENAENCYIKGPHFSDEGVNNMKVVYWMPLPEKPDMRGDE